MLNIAICDDELVQLTRTEKIISSKLSAYYPEIECFNSAESLRQSMSVGDYVPDIAVLDIELGGIDGISLAKELNQLVPRCRIIFLTNHIDYAPDVYFTDHTWFVLKSNMEKTIGPALEAAIIMLSADKTTAPKITVKSGGEISVIPVSQILFIEIVDRKARIVTEAGEKTSSRPPKEFLGNIPEGCIVRCHQSFYVNIDKIFSIDKNELIVSGNYRIPIGRTYKSNLKTQFFKNLRDSSFS